MAGGERAYSDPPGMPDDERMTPAEFRVVREFLGLSIEWLSTHLEVKPRTVRHWEDGAYPIPDGVRLEIEDLEARTAEFVSQVIDALMDLAEPTVVTYRTDQDYRSSRPDSTFPASWHRAVIARVTQDVPGLPIVYWTPQTPSGPGTR